MRLINAHIRVVIPLAHVADDDDTEEIIVEQIKESTYNLLGWPLDMQDSVPLIENVEIVDSAPIPAELKNLLFVQKLIQECKERQKK